MTRSRSTPRRRSVSSPLLRTGLVALPLAWATVVSAQGVAPSPLPPSRTAPIGSLRPGARPVTYGVMGMALGAALGVGNYFLSDGGRRATGCMPLNCAMPFLVVSGGVSGLFLGRELDARRRALAPRAGGVLTFRTASEAVAGEPLALDVRDTLLVVASDSGAQLYTAGRAPVALRRRGVGLAGMRQVALRPEQGTLVFGTGSALWETPLLTGVASRLAGGAVTALAVGDGWVASGSGAAVRFQRGRGGDGAAAVPPGATTDSVTLPASVEALLFDAATRGWVAAAGGVLFAVAPEGGVPRQLATLPAPVRALSANGQWGAAALGEGGVAVWARSAGTGAWGGAPRLVSGEPRFAYDVALLDDALYVAGGVDGVWRLALAGGAPVVEGASRQVRFASHVRVSGGALWVTDRDEQRVVRLVP